MPQLAKQLNTSNYAGIHQYVSKNRRTCAVVVLNMPEPDPFSGFRASLRRAVPSPSFRAMFAGHVWPEVYTPDDIERLVSVNSRTSGKRQIGLTDANETLHDCIAQSFSTGRQVFVLIHVVKALTPAQTRLGSAA